MKRVEQLVCHLQQEPSLSSVSFVVDSIHAHNVTYELLLQQGEKRGISRKETSGAAQVLDPPVVKATAQLSSDPISFLLESAAQHPDLFVVDRGNGYQYVVLSDVDMYEDVLTFDKIFGNPVTPNMSVNKNIFQIPAEQLDRQ